MNNYNQWNSNMMYLNHVDRLTKIKDRKVKSQKSHDKKFDTSLGKHKKQTISSQYLPLPLVPARQRNLLYSTLIQANISLHQKQLLLQNYLLGRRIVTTQSVLNNKSMKRQFIIHKKISKNMSKSLKTEDSFNKVRQLKFYSFQSTTEVQIFGRGNYFIQINISSLILLKNRIQKNQDNLIKISLKLGLREFSHKALTYKEFIKEKFKFCFRKKDIKANECLSLGLDLLRKNDLIKIGRFIVELKGILEGECIQNQERIQTVLNSQNNPVGSVKYSLTANKLLQ